MRVCVVVPYDLSEEGGVKKNAVFVADELRRLGDEVVVVGPSSRPDLPAGQVGFGGVVNIRGNGSDNRMALFVPPWRVAGFLRRGRFDVLHVHEPQVPTLGYWATWFGPRLPRVATFHGVRERDGLAMGLTRRLTGLTLLSRFHRGIAVSQVAADYVRPIWRKPLTVAPNGVPMDVFHPPAPDAAAPPPGAPLRLLFVSHWRDARKGLPIALEAQRRLAARGVATTLDVVGDGGGAPVPAQPGVTFHGAINDAARLAALYRSCDVFVAPATHGESFGIVLLEAMASARPVVCSDIPGYRDVLGDAGRRFATGNSEALADVLQALASAPAERRALGESARARAESYSWRSVAVRVRDEYRAAIEVARPGVRALAAPPSAKPPSSGLGDEPQGRPGA
jgi:phosphatidylinositol alpha-mannosyltransferase